MYVVKITGHAVNEGDGEGMKVPCDLYVSGPKKYLSVLKALDLKTVN